MPSKNEIIREFKKFILPRMLELNFLKLDSFYNALKNNDENTCRETSQKVYSWLKQRKYHNNSNISKSERESAVRTIRLLVKISYTKGYISDEKMLEVLNIGLSFAPKDPVLNYFKSILQLEKLTKSGASYGEKMISLRNIEKKLKDCKKEKELKRNLNLLPDARYIQSKINICKIMQKGFKLRDGIERKYSKKINNISIDEITEFLVNKSKNNKGKIDTALFLKNLRALFHSFFSYVFEKSGEDNWQTPEKTLKLATGDCEDAALFYAKIIEKANPYLKNKITSELITGKLEETDNSGKFISIAHIFLKVEFKNENNEKEAWIFDPTRTGYKKIKNSVSNEKLIEQLGFDSLMSAIKNPKISEKNMEDLRLRANGYKKYLYLNCVIYVSKDNQLMYPHGFKKKIEEIIRKFPCDISKAYFLTKVETAEKINRNLLCYILKLKLKSGKETNAVIEVALISDKGFIITDLRTNPSVKDIIKVLVSRVK